MDRREQSYWTDRLVGAIVGGEARAGLAHEAAAPSSKTVGCLWVSPEGGTAAAGAPATWAETPKRLHFETSFKSNEESEKSELFQSGNNPYGSVECLENFAAIF